MPTIRVRESFLGLTILAAVVLAACNDSHLVNGAKCSSGVADAGDGNGGIQVVSPGGVHAFPARPTAIPIFHSSGMAASTAPDAVPANAQQLLDAMDVTDTMTIEGTSVTSQSLSDVAKQAAAFMGLGSLQPVRGSNFAWISTGVAGAGTSKALDALAFSTQEGNDMGGGACSGVSGSYDCATLSFSFVTPADAHAVKFDFDFMSSEFPEFVGSDFNDSFLVSMSSPSNNYSNIVYDNGGNPISINSVLFTQPCQSLTGTGFDLADFFGDCDAGGTGVLTTTAPVTPGEAVTMTFRIYDLTDGIYDSAVMLDNFRFDATPIGTPNTGTPTPTPETSPTPSPTSTETPTPTPSPEPTPGCTP